MSRSTPRSRGKLGCFLAIITLVILMLAAIRLPKRSLHPNPQEIPSTTNTKPGPEWVSAVDRARSIARSAVTDQNLPGLSLAVGVSSRIVWAEGFGWADMDGRDPVTPDTRFRIGTASTLLTSAAAGTLIQKGALSLDEEIQTRVPQFPKKPWPVTIRQLMAGVAGLANDSGDEAPLLRRRCANPVQALPQFADAPLLFEPGTQYRTSKYGWILVSAAVEAAAGSPFLTLMNESVFRPLGMDNTGAESSTEENPEAVGEEGEDAPIFGFMRHVVLEPLGIADRKAKPATEPATIYAPGHGPQPQFRYGLHVMSPRNLSCYAGSMAFFSTPSDMVRFGLAINGATLLKPATARLLQTPQRLTSGKETGYGLGWRVNTVEIASRSTQAAGYDGDLLDHRVASFIMFPETGIVVAVMTNSANAETSDIAMKVAAAFAQPGRR